MENAIAEILERKEYVDGGGDACDTACEEARNKVWGIALRQLFF